MMKVEISKHKNTHTRTNGGRDVLCVANSMAKYFGEAEVSLICVA